MEDPHATDAASSTPNDDAREGLSGLPSRCTAKSKRSGQRCKNPPVKGRRTCRMHGGTTPRGPAHPSYRHGKFSALLGERSDFYDDAIRDPALGEFRTTLALLDVRTADLLEMARAGGVSARRLRRAWRAVQSAAGSDPGSLDRAAFSAAAAEMDDALEGAGAAEDAWADLVGVLDTRRKAAASMQLAEARSDRSISAERFNFLMGYVLDSVLRHTKGLPGAMPALRALTRDLDSIVRSSHGEA